MSSESLTDKGLSAGGFFISEDKTAIVYNPNPDQLSPLHVLISDDKGKTQEEIGNPNETYSEHLADVGFSNEDIGFLGFHRLFLHFFQKAGALISEQPAFCERRFCE